MKKIKKAKTELTVEDYIKENKRLNRLEELERNGHWIANDRPHKNKKKYDRKRDRKIDFSCLSCFIKYSH